VSNSAETSGSQPPSHGDHLGERPAEASPSHRIRPVDVALVAAIPVVLVAVFLLPMGLRRDLALLYTEPSVLTMYASHFVHLDRPHLMANLLVYLLVVPFSLAVSVWSGRRRRFYAVAVVVLVAFPLALSVLNVLLPRPRIGMGFSGMNLAFVGYLPHVLADRFEFERPEWARCRAALLALFFFVGTAIVTIRVTASIRGTAQPGLHWLVVAGAGSDGGATESGADAGTDGTVSQETFGAVPSLWILGIGAVFVAVVLVLTVVLRRDDDSQERL
jgi:hypothetical protein